MRRRIVSGLLIVLSLFLVTPGVSFGQGTARFKVRIENVSTVGTIKASNGTTHPAPVSPGVWVVHREAGPFFTAGKPDRGKGLESQSEDGDPTTLAKSVQDQPGIVSSGVFSIPVGDTAKRPAGPGAAYEFIITASPGTKLSFTTMFGQSNDHFYAPNEAGIALFDAMGKPVSGDVTSQVLLWDAGTEVDEEPGIGPNQAPRQPAPNTGPAENGAVRVENGYSHTYPKVSEVIRVTVTPMN